MSRPVMIMAGGTGGHVYPALAVARELMARGERIVWLGTRKGLEARVIPAAGLEIEYLDVAGLRGKGKLSLLLAPFKLVRALLQAMAVMRKHKPKVVLGMGGFVAGPGGVASKLSGVPLVIHEQNGIAGLTNRLLAKVANRVLAAFPSAFGQKGEVTGNPVRSEIIELMEFARRSGEQLHLLVVGGSLGASALNELIPQALALMPLEARPQVIHQCGEKHAAAAEGAYAASGVNAEVKPFIEDMAEAYRWADVVVCRAGAMTVSELAIAGLPAVLVPFPFAVDDHQTANARYLSENGAAWLKQQKDITPRWLADQLLDVHNNREQLDKMGANARAQACPQATRVVADICQEVAK